MLSFPSDTTARIERRGSPGGALVESMLPMQAVTPAGRRVSVDLRLKDHGRWLQPAAPLVDVRLPKRVQDGVLLKGSGVAFRPRVETNAAARVVADKTFYSGISADTDFVLQPTPTGVESFYQLRSPKSPKRLVVDMLLPRSARLRRGEAPMDTMEVVRGKPGHEKILGSFATPFAWDADHEPVEVRWEIAGTELRLDVAHRGRDLTYPIMVDPQWTEDQRYWHRADLGTGPIKDRKGWVYEETDTNGNFTYDEPTGADPGLYLWAGPAAIPGQWAHWVFRAPPETWIFRYETYTSHTTADNGTTLFIGVYGGAGAPGWNPVNLYDHNGTYYGPADVFDANWNWSYFYLTECLGNNPCSPYHTYGNPAGYYGNAAIFQLNKDFGSQFHSAWLGGAQVAMEDDTAPTVSASGNAPGGWVDELPATATATGSASDRGFGVKSFELWRHGAGGGVLGALPGQSQCSDTERPVHCPANDSETFVYSTSGASEGINTYGIRARDFVDNWSGFSNWDVKLDRSPPESLSLASPTSGGWVREAPTLTTDANDRYSGVRSTEIEIMAAADGFSRTTSNGWGSAESGGAWTREAGPSSDFSTDGSTGRIAIEPDSGVRSQSLQAPRHKDVDLGARIKFAQPVTGAGSSSAASLQLRRQSDDAGSGYRVSLNATSDGRLLVSGLSAQEAQVFPTADTGLGFTPGAWYRVRAQLDSAGSTNSSTLRVKVWRDGSAEPVNWQWTGVSVEGPHLAGGIGVLVGGDSTSTQQVAYDDIKLADLGSSKTASNPNDSNPCGLPGCPNHHTANFAWDSSGFAEGSHEVTLRAKDPLGHTTTAAATIRLDRTPPVITARRGTLAQDGGMINRGQQTLSVDASDSPSGVTRIEAFVDDADNPSDAPISIGSKTCATSGCPSMTGDFTWNSTGGPDRVHVTAKATDQAGNTDVDEWTVHYGVDQHDPVLELTGDLKPPIATGRSVHIKARDDQANDSGIQRILLWLDPDSTPTDDEATHVHAPTCAPGCPPSAETDWALPADTPEGKHRILIRARDAAAREDVEDYDVNVVSLLPSSRSKLGLEHWFDYDDTDAGGDSKLYVNGETGNTVWHSVPIVNPGRGLSTVVNLTYNSHDRGGVLGSTLGRVPIADLSGAELSNDLPGLSYSEAGVGFSLGISGPTRLNEPLGGVLIAQMVEEGTNAIPGYTGALPAASNLVVTMTDSDGTVHTFTKGANGEWIAPPGVNMRLRRFRDGGTIVNPIDEKWALTRPDGVTHFFDNLGYLTKTKDRNGNVLEYAYEAYDALTGNVTKSVVNASGQNVDYTLCDGVQLGKNAQVTLPNGTSVPVFCAKRVAKVRDPAGRELKIEYNDYDGSFLGLTGTQLPVEFRADFAGLIGGRGGRIKKITDHANREYTFEYDDQGYLTKFVESANTPEKRTTELGYEAWKSGLEQIGQDRQLTSVKEAETGLKTVVRHVDPDDRSGLPALGSSASPRQACGVTKRNTGVHALDSIPVSGQECRTAANDLEKTYDYTVAEETEPRRFEVDEILMRAQQTGQSATVGTTLHEIDGRGRPTAIVDPIARRTELAWNDDENAVASIKEAAGTPDAALTELSYDQSNRTGVITQKKTYPAYVDDGSKGSARTTSFSYQFSNGVYRSSATGVSDSVSFVADLTEIKKPKEGTGASFEIKQDASGNYLGLVTKRYDKPGRQGNAVTMGYDASGQMTSEQNGVPGDLPTTYEHYDPNGQPGTVIDPRNKVWTYGYDAVGNLKFAVDPRASDATGNPDAAYTTTFAYDAFDRPTSEKIPFLSAGEDPSVPKFRTRSRSYDRNDNALTSTDGAGKTTTIVYTPMDQPQRVIAPGRQARAETTDYAYDDGDRLIARVDPKGTGASPATVSDQTSVCSGAGAPSVVPYMTRYCLDEAGRRIAEVRTANRPAGRPAAPTALITAFAFDGRDNVTGMIDPNRANNKSVVAAQAAASMPAQRFSYAYDKLDQRTDQFEGVLNDAGSRIATLRTHYDYDENGNQTAVFSPRAYGGSTTTPDSSFATQRFYDNRDQLTAVKTPAGCTAYGRREDGKVVAVTSPRGTALDTSGNSPSDNCSPGDPHKYRYFTTTYAYDGQGNVTSRSIPYAPNQYGRSDSEFSGLKVTYARDDVGNPKDITDARGNTFHNTFYDSGELRSTERPSFFRLDWGAGADGQDPNDTPDPGRHFTDDGSGADLEIADGGPKLTEADGRSRNAQRSADEPELPAGNEAGNFGKVDRQDLGDLLPDAGTTSFKYDSELRLTTITDATDTDRSVTYDEAGRVLTKTWPFKPGDSITHTYGYDPNGNLESYKDGRSNPTSYQYDGYDRRIQEDAPGAASDPTHSFSAETTQFDYDSNGNLVSRQTPLGAANVFRFTYDTVDRLVEERNPMSPSSSTPNGERWTYGYDANGNVSTERSPRYDSPAPYSASQFETKYDYDKSDRMMTMTAGFGGDRVTQYGYDPDGNRTSVSSPGSASAIGGAVTRRLQTTDYDGRGLPWRESTSTAGGDDKRTTLKEYDQNGNLSRIVNPKGVNGAGLPKVANGPTTTLADATWHATVRQYDFDDQLTAVWQPWSKPVPSGSSGVSDPQGPNDAEDGGDARRFVQEFQRTEDPLQRVRSIVAPHETSEPAVPKTSYTYFSNGWTQTQSDEKLVPRDGTAPVRTTLVSYDYDKTGNQTLWRTESAGQSANGRLIRRSFNEDGTLRQRVASKSQAGGDGETRLQYDYFYNSNRSLTRVDDFDAQLRERDADPLTPLGRARTTSITRDAAERQTVVNETWPTGRDTTFTYDPNGNVTTRKTDGAYGAGAYSGSEAKVTTFSYDPLDRETSNRVDPQDAGVRTTSTTWWDSGEISVRTKPNGTAESYFYNPRGEITQKRRAPSQGSAETQDYSYDRDGNRTRDERGTHVFDPRGELVRWTRAASYGQKAGTSVSYERNGAGDITKKIDGFQPVGVIGATTTTFNYTGELLRSADTTIPTPTAPVTTHSDYSHDDFGSVTKIVSRQTGPAAPPSDPPNGPPVPEACSEISAPPEATTTRYCFDEFERMISSRGEGVPSPTNYVYDGLDRRDRKTDNENGQPRTHDYSYVGTSNLVSRETDKNGEVKHYDYDSQGRRLGQSIKKPTETAPTFRVYAKDANGSVMGLEDSSGGFGIAGQDTYLYDPYGEPDKVIPPSSDPTNTIDPGLSQAAKDNPFRFEGFYYDSGVKTYDMQARQYRPDVARFLSQDRFESATGDQFLQADPLTQNRYAFAGGNPVNNVEFDGHRGSGIRDTIDQILRELSRGLASVAHELERVGTGRAALRLPRALPRLAPVGNPQPLFDLLKLRSEKRALHASVGTKRDGALGFAEQVAGEALRRAKDTVMTSSGCAAVWRCDVLEVPFRAALRLRLWGPALKLGRDVSDEVVRATPDALRYAGILGDPTLRAVATGMRCTVSKCDWRAAKNTAGRLLATGAHVVDMVEGPKSAAEGCSSSLELGPFAPLGCAGVLGADYYVNRQLRKITFVKKAFCDSSYLRSLERAAWNC